MANLKNYIMGIVSIVVAMLVLGVGGELALRLHHFVGQSITQNSVKHFALDDKFGWLPAPNFSFAGELQDASGQPYTVSIKTDGAGFRLFGNPQETNKPRVMFLGDSYTHAMQVSNDKTYFALLGRDLSIEIFALGVGGYGTLQQSMMLDKYIDEIQPDAIVLQFCPNDIINNSVALERASVLNNSGMRRPYMAAEGIAYELPRRFPALRHFANNYSRFLYFIISKVDRIRARPTYSVESAIDEQGMSLPEFSNSIAITELLLQKIRQRTPAEVPIYAFVTDYGYPYYEQFQRMSKNSGLIFIDGVPQALSAAQDNGIVIRAGDGAHWNNAGHAIVAEQLKSFLEPKLRIGTD